MSVPGHVIPDSGKDFLKDSDPDDKFLGHAVGAYGFVLAQGDYMEQFILNLNPQSIEQDEEAAVNIIPTQGGGKWVENNGNIFKEISISGTTGFLPGKSLSGLAADDTEAKSKLSDVSGYLAFHKLRGMFRRYWEIHRQKDKAARDATKLLFFNAKDDEIWLVEPLSFRMPRSSKSPMLYNYSIRLRALTKDYGKIIPEDYVPQELEAEEYDARDRGFPDTAKSLDTKVEDIKAITTPDKLRNSSGSALSALRSASDFIRTVNNEVLSKVNYVLDVVENTTADMREVMAGVKTTLSIPRVALDQVCDVVDDIMATADYAGNVMPLDLLYSLVGIKQDLYYLMSTPSLFKKRTDERWQEISKQYKSLFGGSDYQLSTTMRGFATTTILPGDTPWSMASRIFNDPTMGYVIIAANNLRYPYFTNDISVKGDGVLGVGDPVAVPSSDATSTGLPTTGSDFVSEQGYVASSTGTGLSKSADSLTPVTGSAWNDNQWEGYTVEIVDGTGTGQTRTVVSNTKYGVTVDAAWDVNPGAGALFRLYMPAPVSSRFDNYFGTDLLLDGNNDLSVTATGDLATVSGLSNFRQALHIKTSTEQGSLPLHPWFGLGFSVGVRAKVSNLLIFRLNCERTLRADPRTDDVKRVKVSLVRDTLQFSAEVYPKFGARSVKLTKTV